MNCHVLAYVGGGGEAHREEKVERGRFNREVGHYPIVRST